jgi:hypothetical protein
MPQTSGIEFSPQFVWRSTRLGKIWYRGSVTGQQSATNNLTYKFSLKNLELVEKNHEEVATALLRPEC